MPTLLARYLCNDAASGTAQTTVADTSGNGHNITMNWGTGSVGFVTGANGTYLDRGSATNLNCYGTTTTLPPTLWTLDTYSIVAVLSSGSISGYSAGWDLGDSDSNYTGGWDSKMGVGCSGGDFWTTHMWSDAVGSGEKLGGDFNAQSTPLSRAVYLVQVDSGNGTGNNRMIIYENNSRLGTSYYQQNTIVPSPLTGSGGEFRILGQRTNGLWSGGGPLRMHYFEIWDNSDALFTAQERADMTTNLLADDDAPWIGGAGPGPLEFTQQPQALNPTQTEVTGQATVDEQ